MLRLTVTRGLCFFLLLPVLFTVAHADSEPSLAERIATLEGQAEQLSASGEPREAVHVWDQVIELRLGGLTAGEATTAQLMERQAKALEKLEEYDRAEQRLRQALELREPLHGSSHHTVRELQRRLSEVIRRTRADDPEAESLLLRRHDLQPSFATHRDLGNYYHERGDHERAIEQLSRAAELAASNERNRLWRLPPVLAELAEAYRAAGYDGLAETHYLRAIEAREDQHGESHPHLVQSLRQISEYLIDQQRWGDAETHLRRALTLKESAYGECDACNRDVVKLLSTVLDAQGREIDFCTGEPARAAPASDGSTPDERAAELQTLDERVQKLMRREQFARAREVATRSLELREASYGPEALELTRSLRQLATVAHRLKGYGDELVLWQRILEIYELHLEPDHSAAATAFNALCRAAERLEDHDLAVDYLARELQAREASGQAMLLARAMSRLGRLERTRGEERRAGEQFLLAADLWEQIAGSDAREFVNNRIDLAASYDALGLDDEAESVLTELLELEQLRQAPRLDLQLRILEPLEAIYVAAERKTDVAAAVAEQARIRKLQNER